jgi:Uma2 family endonuclease
MATVVSPPEQRVVLHGVSWETYESLLADHVDRSVPHFTYDRGELEILSPSTTHEEDNRTLALLVEIVASELSIDVRNVGSMTFRRRELKQGFEPDTSFYIENEDRVRGRSQIELAVDPPPDLVIEMEVTRSAIPKLPLYANVGVPEVWRSDGERVVILRLVNGEYMESPVSEALPPLTSETLTEFLIASRSLRRSMWLRHVRDWARAQAGS